MKKIHYSGEKKKQTNIFWYRYTGIIKSKMIELSVLLRIL